MPLLVHLQIPLCKSNTRTHKHTHTHTHTRTNSSSPLLSIISESYDMVYLAAANTQAGKTAEGKTNVRGIAEDEKRERKIERVRALRADKEAFVR